MQLLDLTLDTPAKNLALDEALLEAAEQSTKPTELLRLWESPQMMVVVGSSTHLADEVNLEACRQLRVPVLRRPSGGAPIVAGPGCLMYAVVLSYQLRPELRMIDRAHRYVLEKIAATLSRIEPGIKRAGSSDLALGRSQILRQQLALQAHAFSISRHVVVPISTGTNRNTVEDAGTATGLSTGPPAW